MPEVTYLLADGQEQILEVAVGDSVMDGAVDHGVPGILGQCGGGRTCLTCHCYVDEAWFERLPPVSSDEIELLDYVVEPGPTSRLACQIMLSAELSGLRVRVPVRQI